MQRDKATNSLFLSTDRILGPKVSIVQVTKISMCPNYKTAAIQVIQMKRLSMCLCVFVRVYVHVPDYPGPSSSA